MRPETFLRRSVDFWGSGGVEHEHDTISKNAVIDTGIFLAGVSGPSWA
jgi:hypothetical protein